MSAFCLFFVVAEGGDFQVSVSSLLVYVARKNYFPFTKTGILFSQSKSFLGMGNDEIIS